MLLLIHAFTTKPTSLYMHSSPCRMDQSVVYQTQTQLHKVGIKSLVLEIPSASAKDLLKPTMGGNIASENKVIMIIV